MIRPVKANPLVITSLWEELKEMTHGELLLSVQALFGHKLAAIGGSSMLGSFLCQPPVNCVRARLPILLPKLRGVCPACGIHPYCGV